VSITKAELVTEKKSGLLEGLKNIGGFLGQTFVAYQTAKAQPLTVTAAPAPTSTSSSTSGGSRLPPVLVIGGAVVLGAILLRRR
jgi:hypothetical protein